MVAPFFGLKIGEDQKKRSSPQNEWVFGPEVDEDQKNKKTQKKVFAAKSVRFRSK